MYQRPYYHARLAAHDAGRVCCLSFTVMSEQAGLAGTLRLAISQCRQQDEALLARESEIRSMKEDNVRLQARVSELETANRSLRLEQDHEWAQALLQRHVEAQAEIAYLKRKLKAYKEMLHQDLPTPVPTSTPLMNVAAPTAAPTDGATKRKHSAGLSPSATHLTRPAKHSRTEIEEGISVNGTDLTDERAQLCGKKPNIIILTEDGEDYAVGDTAGATSDRSSVSSFRRLAGLLEQPQSD